MMTSTIPEVRSGPDPAGIGDRHEFGRSLTELRERAGRTVRDIAAAVGVPLATVGDYFAGRSLPPVRMAWVLDAILDACGVTDPAYAEDWRRALLRLRRLPRERPAPGEPPYPGFAPFDTRHARWFHGRQAVLLALTRRVVAAHAAGGPVVVAGASGAGTSSLLRAGLLGTIGRDHHARDGVAWRPVPLAPGGNPCRALADHLCSALDLPQDAVDHAVHARPDLLGGIVRGAVSTQDRTPLVIVDRFDAVFTRCRDDRARRTFVDALSALTRPAADGRPAAVVVLALRADRLAAAARLGIDPRPADRLVRVGPLSRTELHDVIVRPADHAGVRVAPELVDVIRHDLGPAPHGLAVLSTLLLSLWHRRGTGGIGTALYHSGGGLTAVAADLAVGARQALDAALRPAADLLVSRLRERPTRYGVDIEELLGDAGDDHAGHHTRADVLERLASARLVTIDADGVRPTHPAMLTAWPGHPRA